jgi:gluconolactonase
VDKGGCKKIYTVVIKTSPTITIYDAAGTTGNNFETVRIEKVATGFGFSEGPVWHPDNYLLFSDIPGNRIWQLSPSGEKKVYLENSGFTGKDTSALSDQVGSNGLAIDKEQNLLICQHGNHALSILHKQNGQSVLTGKFEGKPFNSPNDLVVKSDGTIFFSDPPYGLRDRLLNPGLFQSHAGVYLYKNGITTLLTEDFRYPNGLCFSPDERYLYVSSNHPDEPYLWRYELSSGNEVLHQTVLIQQNADGIKSDEQGNIYMCTDEGILVVSPEGKKLALIHIPETPANIAWAGSEFRELFCTARSSIYHISLGKN